MFLISLKFAYIFLDFSRTFSKTLIHHIFLCFSLFFNFLATSDRRRELNVPGPAGSLYAQRRHLAVCNHGARGRHRRPRRAQLERVLRHLHWNPKLIETRPLLSSSYKPLLRRRQAQQASAIVALTPEFGSLRRSFRSGRCFLVLWGFWDHSSGEGVGAGEKEAEVAELRRWRQFYCFGLRFVRSVLTSQVMNSHDSRFVCAFFLKNLLFIVFSLCVWNLGFCFCFATPKAFSSRREFDTRLVLAVVDLWYSEKARGVSVHSVQAVVDLCFESSIIEFSRWIDINLIVLGWWLAYKEIGIFIFFFFLTFTMAAYKFPP